MKAFATILAAGLLLAASVATAQTPAPKPAASAPAAASSKFEAPVIAVIDVNEVLQRSKAGNALTPQFDKLKRSYEDELTKERDALGKEIKQLEGQRAVLAPEAFSQRASALHQRDQALARKIAERKRVLDATLSSNLAQIRNVMFQVAADIATERGINVVLPKDMVVIIARNLEITDEVLKRVDKKLPTLKLKVAQPPTAKSPAAQSQRKK